MGEAKQRKANDSMFGRVPKKGMGLVISNPVRISEDGGATFQGGLDPEELRFSVLFWDRLLWPQSRIFGTQSDEADFLESAGILSKPTYELQGFTGARPMGELVAGIHLNAFKQLNEREPGLWSIAQGEKSFLDLRQAFDLQAGAAYQLTRAIPVPDTSVPLADILEFKERRRDELLTLRQELEQFFAKIEKAGDEEAGLRVAVTSIEKACLDAIAVSKEARFPFRMANLKSHYSIDWNKLIGAGLLATVANSFGMPTLLSVLSGLGFALKDGDIIFRTEGDVGIRGGSHTNHPYRYVSSFTKEVFNR